MRATCPDCGTQGHLATFFAEDDGKRLAALMADMEPVLGRAVIGYLGLFKPAKTALRMQRAASLVDELRALVNAGSVCRDERGGVRRSATPAMWAQGIEQMLAQRGALSLPLSNHHYLRAVVYGIADSADAASERQKEADARLGKHLGSASGKAPARAESPLENALAFIEQQRGYGAYDSDDAYQAAKAEAWRKHGAG